MPYNIIVCVKVIPDIEQIRADANGLIDTKNIPLRIETLSENSVEEAVRLKEKYGGKVTALIFGTQETVPVMKKAYAMGVDDGLVITGYKGNNPMFTAKVLSEKIKKLPHDIIILGNQSADSYTGLLPGNLAALLGYNVIGNAVKIELADRRIKVKKLLESKNVLVEGDLPAIVSVAQEINEPRLPPVMQIMAAGRKQIPVEAVGLDAGEYTKIISNTAPKSERKRKIFEKPDEGIAEVVRVLKEEIR